MTDDQRIKGYRALTDDDIKLINLIKELEVEVGKFWTNTLDPKEIEGIDHRWMSIARTHFEEGFSAFVRAIAQPESRFK